MTLEGRTTGGVGQTQQVPAAPIVDLKQALKRCTLLIASIDDQIRDSISELLEAYGVNTIWAKRMEEIKSGLTSENIAACFCGFWLVDGTYRDIVRYVRRRQAEIPLIVVCPPACPQEQYESLAALNIRAFDFIRHPYRRQDMERVLHAALPFCARSSEVAAASGIPPHGAFGSSAFRPAT
jgi:DNA-binding NtrC family response regulator